jgi:hypothetical protein
MTAQWRAAPNQGAWRVEVADHNGCRLSIRYTAKDIYHAFLNGRSLGLWGSRERAREAAETAALVHKPTAPCAKLGEEP